jgi:tetratricopeptide (TPR) repeat protein
MQEFPFSLPQSLAGYLDTFQNEPEKTLSKLNKHLSRRGYDAVGTFLLSWFYLQLGERDQAIAHALKAKTYAPGSPFLEYVHYFLVHPGAFTAWKPESIHRDNRSRYISRPKDFLMDLEALIGRLSEVEGRKISMREKAEEKEDDSEKDLSDSSKTTKKLASFTLIDIHASQDNFDLALSLLKQMEKNQPSKKEQILKKRDEINAMMQDEDEDEDEEEN